MSDDKYRNRLEELVLNKKLDEGILDTPAKYLWKKGGQVLGGVGKGAVGVYHGMKGREGEKSKGSFGHAVGKRIGLGLRGFAQGALDKNVAKGQTPKGEADTKSWSAKIGRFAGSQFNPMVRRILLARKMAGRGRPQRGSAAPAINPTTSVPPPLPKASQSSPPNFNIGGNPRTRANTPPLLPNRQGIKVDIGRSRDPRQDPKKIGYNKQAQLTNSTNLNDLVKQRVDEVLPLLLAAAPWAIRAAQAARWGYSAYKGAKALKNAKSVYDLARASAGAAGRYAAGNAVGDVVKSKLKSGIKDKIGKAVGGKLYSGVKTGLSALKTVKRSSNPLDTDPAKSKKRDQEEELPDYNQTSDSYKDYQK